MGTKKHRITKETRGEILRRIKEEGISVGTAAEEYGIHYTTIYGWISKKVEDSPTYAEVSKLKKENKELLRLVGELTLQLSHTQKKSS
jgi:transposase-like protein